MAIELTLWGATGFTGRLVARYLAAHAPADLSWALGGRSKSKLEQLRDELGRDLPVVVADSSEPTSLRAMVAQTRVVVSTVGPYAAFGTPLVAACAELGRDYADLSGEPQWIRRSIETFDTLATQTGARIVHSCGFDCIPADLSVWMAHQALGAPMRRAQMRVLKLRGGVSGGTVASMLRLLEDRARDPEAARWFDNVYALVPDRTPTAFPARHAYFDPQLQRWVAPFVMDAIDVPVVHRTNALLGYAYGKDFAYDEGMCVDGRLAAHGLAAGLRALHQASRLATVRRLLAAWAPAPGSGPSPERQRRGAFVIQTEAEALDGRTATTTVRGELDPGYAGTALMLAETGLALARDAKTSRGGVLTPAAALGSQLRTRLAGAGFTLEAAVTQAPQ